MTMRNNILKNKANLFKIVCFFARDCGVEALKELLNDKRFTIIWLLVHSKLPKSEDPNRGIRPEFAVFKEIANNHSIPMSVIDTREEAQTLKSLRTLEYDFLISLSWRFLIPKEVFSKAKLAAINVHRGKLPEYRGAQPIKRALEKREQYITITAHEMVEEIDAGRTLIEKHHPVNYDNSRKLMENIERIKKEILPLYPKVIIEAIEDIIERGYEK